MLTRVIEDIAAGKTSPQNAQQAMIKLGVAKLPEVEKDNTDRNRTSPFAFTGAKFEFRAVGASQSIAFPVMLLNATVAEALGELITALKAALKRTKSVDDAVLEVVRQAFKETGAVRFEGNNYSNDWVVEAEKRKLLNLRRTPEALAQLLTKDSRAVLTKLGILSKPEIESRFDAGLSAISSISAPAANARGLPVITMAPMLSSTSKVFRALTTSRDMRTFSALSDFGRFSVMRPTRSRRSTMMVSYRADKASRGTGAVAGSAAAAGTPFAGTGAEVLGEVAAMDIWSSPSDR